ncbi:protein lap4 isoform X15, partial [Haematococcus lacustris]
MKWYVLEVDLRYEMGLSALQHLKHLSVGCLGRTALASPALDSLQGLTSLECPANRLARLPPSLLQHSLLLSLDLASNGMHELPRTVRCLVHLRRLDLRTNQLKRTLYVSHNRLRELPEELSCLVSLTLLDASMNCLMLLPRHWERLKDLQCLMFNENKAGDATRL